FELKGRSKDEVLAELRQELENLPGVNLEIGQPISHRIDAMLSGTKANIAIKVSGPELNQLFAIGNQIKGAIEPIEGMADLNVEQQVERPQLTITPKRDLLARYGITLPEFAEFVEVMLAGRVVSQVYEGGRALDLTVRVTQDYQETLASIRELTIDANGRKVPLEFVADIRSVAGPNTINRENVQRHIVVSANVAGRDLRGVVNDIQEAVARSVTLPEGYYIAYGARLESEAEACQTLLVASLFSLLIVFLLLCNQFKSTLQAIVILWSLPLARIGGVVAIWFTSGI